MINFIYKLFNHDKIDDLNNMLSVHMKRIEQLEAEVREYKGYKLKYKVTKMYVDDDEGLLELFEIAKKAENAAIYSQREILGNGFGWSLQQGLLGLAASQSAAAAAQGQRL